MIPLLDRPVTIPPGIRRINESAALLAADLWRQTGLRVSYRQSVIAGYPWGMEEVMFAASNEPARSVFNGGCVAMKKFCCIDTR